MYICLCKSVTDHQIRRTVRDRGITSMSHLCNELDTCRDCGKCALATRNLLRDCLSGEEKASG